MTRLAALAFALTMLAAGCGSTSRPQTGVQATTATKASSSGPTASTLHQGVIAALTADHRLALRVLWTNRVPATATRSTRGPALAGMRASAKGRQRERVHVRMLHDTYRIISIRLNPSYTTATAIARSDQKLVLVHLDGSADGQATRVNERARIDLRRIGSSSHFVVWRLTLLK